MKKFFLYFILMLISQGSNATSDFTAKSRRKLAAQESPFAVLPLSSTAESVLQSSEMKDFIVEDQQDDKRFRKQVERTIQKFPRNFPLQIDRHFFVYDCLFLNNEAVTSKYPKISQKMIHQICNLVQKEFRVEARK